MISARGVARAALVRRRTDVVGRFPGEMAALVLIGPLVVMGLVWALASQARAGVSFRGLGNPSGYEIHTGAISADGSTVVGRAIPQTSHNYASFRWTEATGTVLLDDLPGGITYGYAYAVSGDGSVVVGDSDSWQGNEAFRWTQSTGTCGLGDLPGGTFDSRAYGISADGTVIVGSSQSTPGHQAFRWTQSTGMVGLGDLPGGSYDSIAYAVSRDGSVIAGMSTSSKGMEAFRWTASGMTGLGDLAGGAFSSMAWAVSSDSSVIVGRGTSSLGEEAFRWTETSGMVGLGELPGGRYESGALGVSRDGSVIVGYSDTASGNEAFIWDALHGMRNLREVLVVEYGLDMTGWTLVQASGVSGDGGVICGYGYGPNGTEAWIATVPEPAALSLLALGGGLALIRRKRMRMAL